MRQIQPLLIAIPSFALGAFMVATLTTTARGQIGNGNDMRPAFRAPRWEYKIVGSEADLNRWGADGWEYCGEAAYANPNTVGHTFTLRRSR